MVTQQSEPIQWTINKKMPAPCALVCFTIPHLHIEMPKCSRSGGSRHNRKGRENFLLVVILPGWETQHIIGESVMFIFDPGSTHNAVTMQSPPYLVAMVWLK